MTEIKQETAALEATTESATSTVQEESKVQTETAPQETLDILSSIADDLKGSKSLEKFKGKDINELAKSYVNLESLIGKKITEMPEDVVKEYLKVPSSPEEYVLAEGADSVIAKELLEVARANNVSQEQMKAISDALVEHKRNSEKLEIEEADKILAERKAELEKEFGTSLEKRMDSVKKVLTQFGGEEMQEKLKQSGLLHDVSFVKFLDKVTQEALKVKMVGSDYQAQYVPTPEEARQLIQQKYADKNFSKAYFDSFDPGHKAAVAEMQRLFDLTGNA